MQDRVPTKPNRALVRPEDGSPAFYATITRADEPTQEGTPLNKRTLLTDETAALFELNNTAVPDDAFKAIGQNFINGYPQIGDLRYSVLESIDDKWLRCDGSLINDTDYPVLFERLHGDGAGRVMTETNDVVLTDVVYGDGYTVAYTKGGACTCYVTSDPSNDWTPVTITSTEYADFTVCYDNGMWVAFAHSGRSVSSRTVYIWTATNPLGDWTGKTFEPTSSSGYCVFYYKNSTFFAYFLGSVCYATKNLSGSWVQSDPGMGFAADTNDISIAFGNELWVLAGKSTNAANGGGTGLKVVSTADPTSGAGWTVEKDNMSYPTSIKSEPYHITCFKNYWALATPNGIYITNNLGSWPSVATVSIQKSPTSLAANTERICCAAGNTLMVATDPTEPWTEVQLPTLLVSTYAQTHYGITFDGDGNLWTVGQETFKFSNGTEGAAYPTFYTEAARKLPNIEVDAAYSYIRAK